MFALSLCACAVCHVPCCGRRVACCVQISCGSFFRRARVSRAASAGAGVCARVASTHDVAAACGSRGSERPTLAQRRRSAAAVRFFFFTSRLARKIRGQRGASERGGGGQRRPRGRPADRGAGRSGARSKTQTTAAAGGGGGGGRVRASRRGARLVCCVH